MRKPCVSSLLLVLIGLTVLAPTAYAQSVGDGLSQPQRRLYQVRNQDNQTGFIDKTGKLVIGFDRLPVGVRVGAFYEGLAAICFPDNEGGCRGFGFINQTGKIVIAPNFKYAWRFSEGLAYVETREGAGFINGRGEMVIKLKEGRTREFHEGLVAVFVGQGWNFIDRTGNVISKERYTRVGDFSEGLAAVAIGMQRRAKYGFINRKGEMVIAPRFQPLLGNHKEILSLSRFADGLAKVQVDDSKLYGYIDKKGEMVIPPRFRDAEDFSEGLASVQMENGEMGYIDKSGRSVISLRVGRGNSFKEGLAAVTFPIGDDVKLGYIDRTGKVVIEPKFDGASDFVGGVAQVYFEDVVVSASGRLIKFRTGYIDRTGKYIWQPQ